MEKVFLEEYSVSVTKDGKVYGKLGNLRKFWLDKKGYWRLSCQLQNGRSKTMFVHRLVALAYIPNLLNKPFINHLDGDRQNNRADNLEWCTHTENVKHGVARRRALKIYLSMSN